MFCGTQNKQAGAGVQFNLPSLWEGIEGREPNCNYGAESKDNSVAPTPALPRAYARERELRIARCKCAANLAAADLRYNPQMATHKWLGDYAAEVAKIYERGGETEASYRKPIQDMLEAAAAEFGAEVSILHEPAQAKDIGSPDFRVSSKGGGIVGYVECKAPGANLQKPATKAQVQKYRALSENIFLTDSFRWMLLRGDNIAGSAHLSGKPGKHEREVAAKLIQEFLTVPAEQIGDSERLASALAGRCAMLREGLARYEPDGKSHLHNLFGDFRKALDRDLDFPRFADVFAQTIVYSLLMAKLNAPAGEKLALDTVRRHIPENFAVIRDITMFLVELTDSRYGKIEAVVNDILAIINEMNGVAVAESMSYKKGVIDGDDPYLNFYEDFLAAYDPKLRENRGVYYTPPPVARFIVRAADDLLKRDFGIPEGFAAKNKVTALDFATGTGTFMLEMTRLTLADADRAKRDMLVRGHFLKNFHGFELMASAYVISHLKLSRFLADNGVALRANERIKIYLTNTLEKVSAQIELALLPELADEARHAQKIKDKPVLVIVGNPPYSAASQNKSAEQYKREHKKIKGRIVNDVRDTWIGGLLRGVDDGKKVGGSYYEVDGEPLDEKNPKLLQDDYVKFLRFAQRKMDKAGRGIVAVITNHAFLENPTFRGMRQSLMETFDALYFWDLHGNSNKQEKPPEGGADNNVFDIQQGVAISLLVKNPAAKKKGVFHADLWGKRQAKYDACLEKTVGGIKWAKIKPAAPFYFFVPHDNKGAKKFRREWRVPDIFAVNGSGIKTHRDHFAYGFSAEEIKARVRDFTDAGVDSRALREKYNLKGWDFEDARKALAQKHSFDESLKQCMFRPFDARWCYYSGHIIERHRPEVMPQMFSGDNLGLVTVRQVAEDSFNHVFVADKITDSRVTLSNKGTAYLYPLYRHENGMGKSEQRQNFTAEFRRWVDERYGKSHKPEDILGCIYATLHSPDYRKRYGAFLRTDFPRIPFPESNAEFKRLAVIGRKLMDAHLLRANCAGKYGELRGDGTSHEVEKVRYDENAERLYFNKEECFAPLPPDIFNFQIGGYKPLDKFLKSRKGRVLSLNDIDTIKQAANAIAFTIKKMGEIDG